MGGCALNINPLSCHHPHLSHQTSPSNALASKLDSQCCPCPSLVSCNTAARAILLKHEWIISLPVTEPSNGSYLRQGEAQALTMAPQSSTRSGVHLALPLGPQLPVFPSLTHCFLKCGGHSPATGPLHLLLPLSAWFFPFLQVHGPAALHTFTYISPCQ